MNLISSSSAFTSTMAPTITSHSKEHVNQQWSSSSYDCHDFHDSINFMNKRIESSILAHEKNTNLKRRHNRRHHVGKDSSSLSSFSDDKYNSSYDQPVRCPLRRLSSDSLTSTISTSSWNSSKHKVISHKNNCMDVPKTEQHLPKHISFESHHLIQNTQNILTPPKHPKRTTTALITEIEKYDNKGIISALQMTSRISRRNPIRCCSNENELLSSNNNSTRSSNSSDDSKNESFHQRRRLRLGRRRPPILQNPYASAADVAAAAAATVILE